MYKAKLFVSEYVNSIPFTDLPLHINRPARGFLDEFRTFTKEKNSGCGWMKPSEAFLNGRELFLQEVKRRLGLLIVEETQDQDLLDLLK